MDGEGEFFEEDLDGGSLERRGEVVALVIGEESGEFCAGGGDGDADGFLDGAESGGFEAGEAEVEAGDFGDGKGIRRMGISKA